MAARNRSCRVLARNTRKNAPRARSARQNAVKSQVSIMSTITVGKMGIYQCSRCRPAEPAMYIRRVIIASGSRTSLRQCTLHFYFSATAYEYERCARPILARFYYAGVMPAMPRSLQRAVPAVQRPAKSRSRPRAMPARHFLPISPSSTGSTKIISVPRSSRKGTLRS